MTSPTRPLFARLSAPGDDIVRFTVDGVEATARRGDSVAAALLACGLALRETAVSGAPRAPYCMMGVCFDCLVAIDGVGNKQGCLVEVAEGMRIELQRGRREAER